MDSLYLGKLPERKKKKKSELSLKKSKRVHLSYAEATFISKVTLRSVIVGCFKRTASKHVYYLG